MPDTRQTRTATLQRQSARLNDILQRLTAADRRFLRARVITFLAGAAALTLAFFAPATGWALGIAGLFFAGFIAIVFLHRRLDRARQRFHLAQSLVRSQLARMDLDWQGIPPAFPIQPAPDHPFDADLAITGERSLHRLVDTAASKGGSQRLADWLLAPMPDLDAIHRRHALLNELTPLAGFRSRLAVEGLLIDEEVHGRWDGETLLQQISRQQPTSRSLPRLLTALTLLALVNIALFVLNLTGVLPPFWIAGLAIYGVIYLGNSGLYQGLFEDVYRMGKSLDQFRAILVFLEKASFKSTPELARVCAPFNRPDQQPSRYLRKLVWISIAASLGNNPVLALAVNVLFPWNLAFALLLARYQAQIRGPLAEWLDAWYELEAICALANFAWLNPDYGLPRFVSGEDDPGSPVFEAHALGHPLIPQVQRVSNDYAIAAPGDVAIVTGSNMSGKSTFLRTVGINLCLANAGGPVAAAGLSTLAFRPFTCIQVSDSLADGISYFYAEVRRLKQLLQELDRESPFPLFFLIDEIYRGTNNRERRIGSQAFIHRLSQGQGVGLVSTHDLDLVELASLGHNVRNFHFREEVRDNRMEYDYCLRPGPCPTTNALKIMEIEGLPVIPPD
jgi:hypothetical protein